MKIAFFDSKSYDIESFNKYDIHSDFKFFDTRLSKDTVYLASGYDAVCVFVNDIVNKEVIDKLTKEGKLKDAVQYSDEQLEKLLSDDYEERGVEWIDPKTGVEGLRDYLDNYDKIQNKISSERLSFGSIILDEANIDKAYSGYANNFLNDKYLENLLNKKIIDANGMNDTDLKSAYKNAGGSNEDATRDEMAEYVGIAKAIEDGIYQLKDFTEGINSLTENEKAFLSGTNGENLTKEQLEKFRDPLYDRTELYKTLGGEKSFKSIKALISSL